MKDIMKDDLIQRSLSKISIGNKTAGERNSDNEFFKIAAHLVEDECDQGDQEQLRENVEEGREVEANEHEPFLATQERPRDSLMK